MNNRSIPILVRRYLDLTLAKVRRRAITSRELRHPIIRDERELVTTPENQVPCSSKPRLNAADYQPVTATQYPLIWPMGPPLAVERLSFEEPVI